jgi:hypothetical protein
MKAQMTNKRKWSALALAGIVASAFGAEPAVRPKVTPSFDSRGLTSLKVGGLEQLADATVRVTKVRMADTYRNPYELADPYVKDERTFTNASVELRSTTFAPANKRLTQTFAWGSVAVSYATAAGKLDARIEVANTSEQTIEQIVLDLLALNVPEGGKLWNGRDNLGLPVLSVIAPRVVTFQRVAFPRATAAVDELLGADLAGEPAPAETRVLCDACYPAAAQAHLMETQRKAESLGRVTDGVCARCQAETRLPRDPLVVAGSPQANRPILLEWESRSAGPATLKVTVGDETTPEVYDGVWRTRAIKPGATEIIEVGLRFGPADQDSYTVAADICQAFTAAAPFVLRWPDRRPIGMAHLSAETDWGHGGNPRGWWGLRDTKAAINTPEGRALFDKWILSYADQLIAVADKAGSQGVIVWDLEGKQYPGVVYYGDPRIMQYTAPEMEAMADAFFKRLTDAGLRVGMCLRPHQIYPLDVPRVDEEINKYKANGFAELPYRETWDQFNLQSFALEFWAYGEVRLRQKTPLTSIHRSPVERLDALITYCKQRWGATLFYVDTPHFKRSREKRSPNAAGGYDTLHNWGAALMSAVQWAELQRRHPDVLLIPEHEYHQYWAATAPYRQPPHDGATPHHVTAMYPEAFSCISMGQQGEPLIGKAVDDYTRAVERGDVLMPHAWFGPPALLTDIYAQATASAPVKVTLAADGRLTLQGQPVTDMKALQQQVAKLVKAKPFAQRRTFFQYAPGSDRATRAAVIEALARADAVIAWAQAGTATTQQRKSTE